MTIRRRGRLDPERADQLLDRASGGPPGAEDRLTGLLAAAVAPQPPGAVAGEEMALRAFRAAREAAAPTGPARRRWVGRRVVGAGAWVAVAATTATAGVAFAASTHPWSGGRPVRPPATPAVVPPGGQASSSTSTGTSAGASGQPGLTPDASGATAGPQLIGLCRSYLTKRGVERGRSLDVASSVPLIEAAGGRDLVETYCTRLLAQPEPTPDPTKPAHGKTVQPGHEPSHKATGKPSIKPSSDQGRS